MTGCLLIIIVSWQKACREGFCTPDASLKWKKYLSGHIVAPNQLQDFSIQWIYIGHVKKPIHTRWGTQFHCPLQWRIYKGAPPARAPPLLKIKFEILKAEILVVKRELTPPPHERRKYQNWRPPLWIFLDPPLPLLCLFWFARQILLFFFMDEPIGVVYYKAKCFFLYTL